MTKFLDGPAAGVVLMLRRSPTFLRVCHKGRSEWDALDQVSDTPRAGEVLYAYRLVKDDGVVFVRPGGAYRLAEYAYIADTQPSDEAMRDTMTWRGWCLEKQTQENAR